MIAPAAASVIEAVTATVAEFHNMLATVAFDHVERAKLRGYLIALHRHLDCMRLCSDNFEAVRFHQKQAEELCEAALHDARRAGQQIKGARSSTAADNVIVPFAPRP